MKKMFPAAMLLICASLVVCGQTKRFTGSGTITFEKTINMYAALEKMISKDNEDFYKPALEQYKKSKPQFKKLTSTLTFSGNQTLYVPGEDTESGGFLSNAMVTQPNTIYDNIREGTTTIQKVVFEEKFLLKDSLRHINWKITNERREIAGYSCRRANALVMDSIYVVAFYTDEIPLSGGPESFTGLPGMIMGVAIPHENITWFATKVVDQPIETIKPPLKGKPTNYANLKKLILGAMADWGSYGKTALKALML